MERAATLTSIAVDPRNLTPAEIEQLALCAVPDCNTLTAAAPSESLDVMSATAKEGAARPEPRDVVRERIDYYRWLQSEESREFGAVFTDQATGEVHSYAHWAPTALQASEQLELDLPGYSKHHWTRQRLAEVLEERALPEARQRGYGVRYVQRCTEQLKKARWSGAYGYSLSKGKPVMFWDEKAGLSRLCPDDAREEAMRLSRRVLGPLEALQADGHALHYCVLTSPNAAAGGLRREMAAINRRLRHTILKAKYPDGSPLFPEIKGALCVLEAPLGSARDWNVHLNVIFVVKGHLDYAKLRQRWHWNLEIRKLATGPGVIRGALTELIKYAVAATVAKSAEKAKAGDGGGGGDEKRIPPPPMLEWTGRELLEWLLAMRGFRRTRTYGCLFRLKKPEAEDMGQIVWLGRVDYDSGRYRLSSALVGSIPGDKSSGQSVTERYVSMLRGLALASLRGAGRMGDSIPRDALHRIEESQQVL